MSKNILGQTFGNVSLDLTTSDITSDKLTGTTEINGTYLTANRGLKTDSNKKLVSTTATATEIEFLQNVSSNIQTQLNAKQATIDSSNRLNADLIGSNGNVSNAEYGHLATVSSNIQDQLNAKQPEITSSARLDMTLCGAGNVDNQDLAKLTLASDLTDTIKNILLTPSSKLIQSGTGLSYDNSTTPPTLNASTTITAGTNLTFSGTTLNSDSDADYNSRTSSFFPTIGTGTATKAAFDGAIMAEAIINYNQTANNPSFISFGTRNTAVNNEITLGTAGKSRFFVRSSGDCIVGGDDTNTNIGVDNNNVYCLGVVNDNINVNANGLYVRCARNRRVLRMDYENTAGSLRRLEIITPNDGTNDADDFILQTSNSLSCAVSGSQVFKCGPSSGQFTVFNFNNASDDRIKSNETPITNALDSMMKLKPYTYDKYDNMEKTGASYLESGLISQDIWYNAPELRHLISLGNYYEADESGNMVNKNLIPTDIDNHEELNDTDFNPSNGWSDQHISSVKYLGLIAYLIKAVQELKLEVDNLKNI